MIRRLARCLKLDRVQGWDIVAMLARSVRVWTGPRMAAYFATTDALSAMPERRRPSLSRGLPLLDEGHDKHEYGATFSPLDEAVISRVDKVGDGVKVTFVTKRFQVMDQECRETNKIDSIASDGKVTYRKVCHDTHLVWVDQTHPPRTVPRMFADGLRGGQLAVINAVETNAYVPIVAWASKAQKRVVVYYGLPLE